LVHWKKVDIYKEKCSKSPNFCFYSSAQSELGAVRRQIQVKTVYNEIVELSIDLVKRGRTPSNKCYALITDSTYTNYLTPQLFDTLADKPIFMVKSEHVMKISK
jgi:hypothetical protein